MCIPNRSTNNVERKRERKKRWFKQGQKWRTGLRGTDQRFSSVGMVCGACLYRGDGGMRR